jgi:putative tryptophan/tyrosine transport system substrate-binding protein
MMNRRTFARAVAAALALVPFGGDAQPPSGKIYRIGFLGSTSASAFASRVEALRAGLRDLGYIEGRNIVIEYRWADGHFDLLPKLAAELVRLKVDVLVVHSTTGASVAKQATTTIPIVMAIGADAVTTGLVQSLARPGGNLTGSTIISPEIYAKRLELLKAAVPRITHVAVLAREGSPDTGPVLRPMETAARSLSLALKVTEVRGPDEFASAFAAIAAAGVDAIALTDVVMLITNSQAIADVAARYRLPSTGFRELAEAGGLIGYGVDALEIFRHAALFVDKILKGTKPSDLPIEQATRFQLIINLKAAKALGLTIPQTVLVRADEVIQ